MIKDVTRIVVKVGSALVTNDGAGLDASAIACWAAQIAKLHRSGLQVVLVSSGAIAEGLQRLGWKTRPNAIHELQAAAAVGQMGLAQAYESSFASHGLHTAQVLLTHADLADRQRYLNARSTLLTLLNLGVVPIINENDTVVTEEIKFGDNDTLGALVTNLVDAGLLVILTDQEGLFTADPRTNPNARLVSRGDAGDPSLEEMAGGAGSSIGRGGMITKVLAAKRAARSGAHTVIASGRKPDVLRLIVEDIPVGTFLRAQMTPLGARKQWLADHVQIGGRVLLDIGATKAVTKEGKSLLPIGVTGVTGNFERGAVVACVAPDGTEIARGLINYGSAEARRIAGKPSSEIEAILGYLDDVELIHRDNLVVT